MKLLACNKCILLSNLNFIYNNWDYHIIYYVQTINILYPIFVQIELAFQEINQLKLKCSFSSPWFQKYYILIPNTLFFILS